MWIRAGDKPLLISSRHIELLAVVQVTDNKYGVRADTRSTYWWLFSGTLAECTEALNGLESLLKAEELRK